MTMMKARKSGQGRAKEAMTHFKVQTSLKKNRNNVQMKKKKEVKNPKIHFMMTVTRVMGNNNNDVLLIIDKKKRLRKLL